MPRAFLIKKHHPSSRDLVAPLKRPWPEVIPELENTITDPIFPDPTSDGRGPYDLSIKARKRSEEETINSKPHEIKSSLIEVSPQPKVVTPPLAIALIDPKSASPDPHVKPGAPLEPLNPNTPPTGRSAWHRPMVPPYLPFNFPLYHFPRHAAEVYGSPGYLNGSALVPPPLVPLSPPRSTATTLQLSPCVPSREEGSPASIYLGGGKLSPPMHHPPPPPPPPPPPILHPDHPPARKDFLYPPWIQEGKETSLSPIPSSDSDSGKEMDLAARAKRRLAPRYQCTDCNKSYSTYSGLSKHRQFHCVLQAKKSFSCKYCDKVYVSLGALKMHIRTHTLPCKCKLCGKAFSRPWLLQGHIRTHTGEKPFACPHCSRAFADRSNLRAHLQTHSDVKKYSCKACSKTFSRMSLLLKHSDGGCSGAQPR